MAHVSNKIELDQIVQHEERLAALMATGLLDTDPDEDFDRLTALVKRLLNVPVTLISLVDHNRQFFKSQCGLPEPWATLRQTPLSHSFCQHVVAGNAPLIIEDARTHPLVCDNAAVSDLHVIAYLGVPIHSNDGHVLGSLCAICDTPRSWTSDEIALLQDMVSIVVQQIELRHAVRKSIEAESRLATYSQYLERHNAELKQYAYIASHDLRQPMRTTRAFAERLDQHYGHLLDNKGQQYVDFIIEGTIDMEAHVTALLEHLLIDTQTESMTIVDMDEVLQRVLQNLQLLLEDTGAEIHFEDLPTVLGYERLLQSVLQNLISNALTYHGHAQPEVWIGATQDTEVTTFSFRDNGIGIDEQYHDSIFDLFERLHSRAEYKGSGMGLAISKKIIERHGGRIGLSSAPGEGTTFWFCVPRTPSPDAHLSPLTATGALVSE